MAELRWSRLLIVIVFLILNVKVISGALEVKVSPYPALVYRTAPPGTIVLDVEAFDSVTKGPLDDVMMANTADSSYFELSQRQQDPKQWSMQVKKLIDKPVGYVFQFNVRGVHGSVIRNKDVKINVTEKNQYSPEFQQSNYQFLALRNGFDIDLTHLGTVVAVDKDNQPYNSIFHYHILDPRAKNLFIVGLTTGEVTLNKTIPEYMDSVTFNVTAIDGGSPQLMGSTQITVDVTDAAPPDIFCVAVDDSIARICWKDPTNGSYVMKYELLFKMDGRNATKIPVHVNGIKDETCSVIRGNQLGQNYTFTVRVFNGLEWSPDSLERTVKINRKGLYGECPKFSNCSVWEPCQNKGECLVQSDLSYTCNCTAGWGGQNCTGIDLCDTNPCHNNGKCLYTGDGTFNCDCPAMYYGKYCQYFNVCTSIPCHNSATCLTDDIGNYTCICEDTYTGEHCETRDLCTPDPCVHGQCNNNDNTSFTCSCDKGYYGDFCENVDICELNEPCLQGICISSNVLSLSEKPYWCECFKGYRGENCDRLDMCEMSKQQGRRLCENNGTCMYVEVSSFRCLCTPGYWGGECQHYDMCVNQPCVGGVCRNISDEGYACDCHGGEYGSHCEHFDPCYNEPCLTNRSTCYNLTNTEYTCDCPEDRFGKNCEKIDGCVLQTCSNNGTCTNISHFGDVECSCPLGFYGQMCDEYDPCLLSPCDNGGTCNNISSKIYTCECMPGFRGPRCELMDPCAPNPCLNNGACVIGIMDNTSYWCMCPTFFYGSHCENIFYCQLDHECQNGATCTVFEGHALRNVSMDIMHKTTQVQVSNNYKCVCTKGYTGERCEKISPCASQPCGQGHCTQQGDGHICYCPDSTERINCDDAYCEVDTSFYDKTGRYVWPRTKSGDVAKVTCHHGPRNTFSLGKYQYASRECAVTYNGDTFWKKPDTRECKELQEEEVSRRLRDLASSTRDASGLRPDQIANITELLEEFFYFSFENLEIAKEMTRVVGNLMDANETVIIESNSRNHSSDRLLWLLEEFTSKLDASKDVSIETENINLKVLQNIEPTKPLEYIPLMEQDETQLSKSGISLNLPEETLQPNQTHGRPRIELMAFRSSSFFIPAENAPPQDIVMKQWVVTAVIHGREFKNLTDPVDIMITNIRDGANHTCVYWDYDNVTWSTEGVVTVERNISHTRCQSFHLTSFAIVLDPSPDHAISEKHSNILTYISYIGCGVSIIGLILTLITYSLFRSLNREKSGKILMNLCLSMLLMNIVFIAGSEVTLSFSGVASCKAVAILLHYFLLTTLMWMLVEAINMYQALITVFTKYSGFFMLKRCIIAWGIPAVIVIITVAINDDNYRSSTDFCFLSHGNPLAFYVSLLGPACVILLVNIVVFVMVSRVILKPRFKGQVSASDSINPAQIRGAFAVMTLLGVTWVFGPFAINEAKLVVNYVFTIFNSLQGFLIFIFRCCFNPEVRMAWILLVKTGKFKRRRGPIKGHSSDTTSKGDSKINNSISETLKSDMYNSVGKPKNLLLQNNLNRDTGTKSRQAKTSKDLHKYFNDFHQIGSSESNGRRYSQSDNNPRRYSQTDCNGRQGNQSELYGPRQSPRDLNGRRISQTDVNGRVRRYSQTDSGGHTDFSNVGVRRASNSGIATIYTGNQNGMRRMSSTGIDEFTKL